MVSSQKSEAGLEGPPVCGCRQMRLGCQALHSSLLMLIVMLTLVLTLATVLVSLCQPLARAKSKMDSLLMQMSLHVHSLEIVYEINEAKAIYVY